MNVVRNADGPVISRLRPIIENPALLQDVQKASHLDTASLESFHSDVNRYAPKMHFFHYNGMKARYA